jgi:hypothetical protein
VAQPVAFAALARWKRSGSTVTEQRLGFEAARRLKVMEKALVEVRDHRELCMDPKVAKSGQPCLTAVGLIAADALIEAGSNK